MIKSELAAVCLYRPYWQLDTLSHINLLLVFPLLYEFTVSQSIAPMVTTRVYLNACIISKRFIWQCFW